MGTKRSGKRALLTEYLERTRPPKIGEAEWDQLRSILAPISEPYLRRLLRQSGIPLEPLVEGIRQDSFEHLERTLIALGREFAAAQASGNREREQSCRRLVITAKDHARLAARRLAQPPEAKARKEEMISWMRVWLENPTVFPVWLALRKRQIGIEDALAGGPEQRLY